MDADVEPEPCRGCRTPVPPNVGWCEECDRYERCAESGHALLLVAGDLVHCRCGEVEGDLDPA